MKTISTLSNYVNVKLIILSSEIFLSISSSHSFDGGIDSLSHCIIRTYPNLALISGGQQLDTLVPVLDIVFLVKMGMFLIQSGL